MFPESLPVDCDHWLIAPKDLNLILAEVFGKPVGQRGYRWCHRCGLSEAGVADVTQEVFLVVMRVLPRYEAERGSFRSWLWSVTRNKIIDRRKSPAKRSMAVGGSSFMRQMAEVTETNEEESGEPTIDEPYDPAGRQALVRRGLEQIQVEFQPSTWAAFWRTVVDGRSHEAVAEELAMSQAAVRQAKSRVLRRLRQQLGE